MSDNCESAAGCIGSMLVSTSVCSISQCKTVSIFFASDVISAAALRADGFADLVRMCYKTMTINI